MAAVVIVKTAAGSMPDGLGGDAEQIRGDFTSRLIVKYYIVQIREFYRSSPLFQTEKVEYY
jgi:hypothetical protein